MSPLQTILRNRVIRAFPLVNHQARRYLDLQEFQSKQILHDHGLRVQRFKVVETAEEAYQVTRPKEYGLLKHSKWMGFEDDISDAKEFVVKAQVLAGGRGKGHFRETGLIGGVKMTEDPDDAAKMASLMLNDYIVTKQTGENGILVDRVMIAEAVRLKKEFYLAIVLDRSYSSGPLLIASPAGGVDIEELAENNEQMIRKFKLSLDLDLDLDTARRIAVSAFDLPLTDSITVNQCANHIIKLYKMFIELDVTQIEINPLGVTEEGEVICVDAKINFDENARFRNKWLDDLELMNANEVDKRDLEARKHGLSFIGLSGDIGCLVNGAGLAMGTMDIIKLHGGEPANFLDVGGGANVEQVKAALAIIGSDPNVKAIFVNIFGGIMRCDTVARGIIEAALPRLPIVVRLEGTHVDEANRLMESSGLDIKLYSDFDEAAAEVVRLGRLRK